MEMIMSKKDYISPEMLVVNMQYQVSILAGSGEEVDGGSEIGGGEQLAPELDFFEDELDFGADAFDDDASFDY